LIIRNSSRRNLLTFNEIPSSLKGIPEENEEKTNQTDLALIQTIPFDKSLNKDSSSTSVTLKLSQALVSE
jgi:hypothetical protein